MPPSLTLSEAIKTDRLEDFIAQAEAAGIGPIDRAKFAAMVKWYNRKKRGFVDFSCRVLLKIGGFARLAGC